MSIYMLSRESSSRTGFMESRVLPRTCSAVENSFSAVVFPNHVCRVYVFSVLKWVRCEVLYPLLFQIVVELCSIRLISFLRLRAVRVATAPSLSTASHSMVTYLESRVGALLLCCSHHFCFNSSFLVTFSLDLNSANLYLGSSNVAIPYYFLLSIPYGVSK